LKTAVANFVSSEAEKKELHAAAHFCTTAAVEMSFLCNGSLSSNGWKNFLSASRTVNTAVIFSKNQNKSQSEITTPGPSHHDSCYYF